MDLASLKSNVDKLDIDKLKTIPTSLSNLKSKVDKIDIAKLAPVPVDLSKRGDALKRDAVKKMYKNAKIKNIEDKIPNISKLPANTTLNARINKIKKKTYMRLKNNIPNITDLATATDLTGVANVITNVSDLVKKLTITQKLGKFKIKLLLIVIMINVLLLKNMIS